MLIDLDNKIDQALKILAESKDCVAKLDDLSDEDITKENNVIDLLIERGLALRLADTIYDLGYAKLNIPMCKISVEGINIIRDGGWIKYVKKQKANSERVARKDIYDYNISKWKSNTFWPALIIGLFGGIYSAIELYKKLH